MSQTETPSVHSTLIRMLGRSARFIVFLCTAGWAFPHVCTEDMDLTAMHNEHTGTRTSFRAS